MREGYSAGVNRAIPTSRRPAGPADAGCETTVAGVLRSLARMPRELLLLRWNWKASLFSSAFRGTVFLAANTGAGWRAAVGAAAAEFLYRSATAGFYGAVTQSFRRVEPRWKGTMAVMVLLPLVAHSLELALHWWRGTPNLLASIAASAGFTAVSTTFNLYAMRRGALLVGAGAGTLAGDLRAIPRLIAGFLLAGPRSLAALLSRSALAAKVGP